MADYQYQWKQNMNYGGFSDDRFLGIKNSFTSAKGVEIRRNPHSLKITRNMKNDNKDNLGNTVTIEDFIGSFVTVKSTGTVLACGKAGKIYRKTAGQLSWTLIYTIDLSPTTKERIINCIEYNDYIYFLTEAQIHRIPVGNVNDTDWTASITLGYKTFNNQSAQYRPAIEINNNLYIGDGRHLGELSSAGVWTYNKIAIFADEEIVALTFGGSMLRIFGTKVLNSSLKKNMGSRKYYWDGTSLLWNESVYFSEPIHSAISNGGDDYVIAGLQPWIYLSSGYGFTKLKQIPFIGDDETCYLGANCIDYFKRQLIFALQFPFGDSSGYKGKEGRGILSYGKQDEKYPNALNFEFPCSQYDNYIDTSTPYPAGLRAYFGAIHNSNGILFMSWAMYSTVGDPPISYGIDILDTTKYNATGELTSLVHYGTEASEDKSAVEIKASFDKLKAGEKIEIYLAKNLEPFGATPELVIDYSDTADRDIYSKCKDIALDIGDYNFLQSKVVLTAGTGQLTTPELFELSIGFDNNIELGD